MNISLSPFAPENLVSRDGFGSPVLLQPAHLHSQAESGAYLQDSSRVMRRRPFIYLNRHTPSSQSRVYGRTQLRSLPRIRRHRASKPPGSSKRVLPWQVTMDQLICVSLSHNHYWYEVGIDSVENTGVVVGRFTWLYSFMGMETNSLEETEGEDK